MRTISTVVAILAMSVCFSQTKGFVNLKVSSTFPVLEAGLNFHGKKNDKNLWLVNIGYGSRRSTGSRIHNVPISFRYGRSIPIGDKFELVPDLGLFWEWITWNDSGTRNNLSDGAPVLGLGGRLPIGSKKLLFGFDIPIRFGAFELRQTVVTPGFKVGVIL